MNKEIDIEFINWMVGYTEEFEFEWENKELMCYSCSGNLFAFRKPKYYFQTENVAEAVYYPLLLQRAIEGVNKKNFMIGLFVMHDAASIMVVLSETNEVKEPFFFVDGIDQAKESALKYIYEQEKK